MQPYHFFAVYVCVCSCRMCTRAIVLPHYVCVLCVCRRTKNHVEQTWAFIFALPQLKDMGSLYQVIATHLGPEWPTVVACEGGTWTFFDKYTPDWGKASNATKEKNEDGEGPGGETG